MRIPKFQLKPFNYSVEWQVYDIPVVKSSITIEPLYGHLPTSILFLVVFPSIGFAGEIVAFNLLELIILHCKAIANSELRASQRRRKVENNQNKIFASASRRTNVFKLY